MWSFLDFQLFASICSPGLAHTPVHVSSSVAEHPPAWCILPVCAVLQVLDLKGSIRVLCRVRPLLEKERFNLETGPDGQPVQPVKVRSSLSPSKQLAAVAVACRPVQQSHLHSHLFAHSHS